jgi:hypothetical protein
MFRLNAVGEFAEDDDFIFDVQLPNQLNHGRQFEAFEQYPQFADSGQDGF